MIENGWDNSMILVTGVMIYEYATTNYTDPNHGRE